MKEEKPDSTAVLARLKDFQRRTAETAFSRLYLDSDAVDRFLVADEVGLGKTIIASAVIARAIDHLWEKVERIDVVYVCSNADIARQNIRRLRVGNGGDGFTEASRLTLLPLHARRLAGKVNFVSLTPSTSLDLRGSQGAWKERALLYCLLSQAWDTRHVGAKNLLQGQIQNTDWWRGKLCNFLDEHKNRDRALIGALIDAFANKRELRERFEDLAERSRVPRLGDNHARRQLVGELRRALAEQCLDSLEPDLLILDEFQRFKDLLDADDEVASLARALFEYQSKKSKEERVRILLLSATPYKMYTRSGYDGEDHHADFLRTVRFLLREDQGLGVFQQALGEFREALADGDGALERLRAAKRTIERILRRVMCRTERLGVTVNRDGMVQEILSDRIELDVGDIEAYAALERVAHATDSGDTVEIWKSAPFALGLMDQGYAIKRRLAEHLPHDETMKAAVRASGPALVPTNTLEAYRPLPLGHARTREVVRQTLDVGAWRLLWIPPSLPYWTLEGAYAEIPHFTKRLIFSSWKVAPKAIAGVLSYEAERRMLEARGETPPYSKLYEAIRPLLRFAERDGRLTAMSSFALLYPSPTWATQFDPLEEAASFASVPSAAEVLKLIETKVEQLLAPHVRAAPTSGAVDQRWYWTAPLLLDRQRFGSVLEWIDAESERDGEWAWSKLTGDGDSEDSHFARHVDEVRAFLERPTELGRPPDDLYGVLAKVIIASPAVVSLRALIRMSRGGGVTVPHLGAAAWIAMGFRKLFNLPETQVLLRASDDGERYWERVLDEGIAGGLQAVMDEYAHMVGESISADPSRPDGIYDLGLEMESAVALRTSKVEYDDLAALVATDEETSPTGSIRCRFALRFGDGKTHDDEDLRQGTVRSAFNSPFRPFVLASTSVGQEGLDFHPYCHAIVHWNLPSNPVDFEQREGRIHRYKGHFIRKNLAARFGLVNPHELRSSDPWAVLFERATNELRGETGDLVPYWILEGPHRIERHVPLLPLSRDRDRYEQLKSALARYRIVFGQPRQEELLRLLNERWQGELDDLLLEQIDLRPR